MREQKFKVWDSKEETMWKEPVTIQDICNLGIEAGREEYHAGNYEGECENPIRDLIFLELTGLRDRNGKEIYEGDIVAITINKGLPSEYTGKWEIYFGSWCYMRKHPIWSSFSFDVELANNCEILGNIYENPELLK